MGYSRKPPKPVHEHQIFAKGGTPLVLAVTLPEGQTPEYTPPHPPHPPLVVEYYIDGELKGVGLWPNLDDPPKTTRALNAWRKKP